MTTFSYRTETASEKNTKEEFYWIKNSISVLLMFHGFYLENIEDGAKEDSPEIAQMMLLCRFTNAIYATTRLTMMGLILEAMGMLRMAIEALQLARLINIEPSFSKPYMDPNQALRPVEVRKELEKLGHDVSKARAQYATISATAHAGGLGESLLLEPLGEGIGFNIGGYVDAGLQQKILSTCNTAVGEYVAFHSGIRQEDVEEYHQIIKKMHEDNRNDPEILQKISALAADFQRKYSQNQKGKGE